MARAEGSSLEQAFGLRPPRLIRRGNQVRGFGILLSVLVLVELKAVSNLAKIHERQVESYLKSTGREARRDSSLEHDGTACEGMESGLLVNFGNLRRLEWRLVTL